MSFGWISWWVGGLGVMLGIDWVPTSKVPSFTVFYGKYCLQETFKGHGSCLLCAVDISFYTLVLQVLDPQCRSRHYYQVTYKVHSLLKQVAPAYNLPWNTVVHLTPSPDILVFRHSLFSQKTTCDFTSS